MPVESPQASRAYADYLALGSDRSLTALCDLYRSRTGPAPPTRHLTTLKQWSVAHDWQGRIRALGRQQQLDAEFAERERVRQVLTSGLALTHERVERLKAIAELLYTDIAGGKRFLKRGMFQDEHFNAGEVRALLATLDDLAKETGGRRPVKDERDVGDDEDQRRIALLDESERAERVSQLLGAARARRAGSAP